MRMKSFILRLVLTFLPLAIWCQSVTPWEILQPHQKPLPCQARGNNSHKAKTIWTPATQLILSWNSGPSQWDTLSQHHFEYLADGNLETDSFQVYGTTGWENWSKLHYHWDSLNYVDRVTHQTWDSTHWANTQQSSWEYDSSGNQTLEIVALWKEPEARWDTISGQVADIHYDGWGYPDTIKWRVVSTSSFPVAWVYVARTLLTYDTSHQLTMQLFESYSGATHRPEWKYEYSSNALGEIISRSYFIWDGSTWIPKDSIHWVSWNDHANHQPDSVENYVWDSGAWALTSTLHYSWAPYNSHVLHTYVPDSLGNLQPNRLDQIVNDSNHYLLLDEKSIQSAGSWVLASGKQHSVNYDLDGFPSVDSISHAGLFAGSTSYVADEKHIFSAKPIHAADPMFSENFVVFPNPASGQISIRLERATGSATAQVLDESGRELLVATIDFNSGESRLSIDAIPPGNYLLIVTFNGTRRVSKLLVR